MKVLIKKITCIMLLSALMLAGCAKAEPSAPAVRTEESAPAEKSQEETIAPTGSEPQAEAADASGHVTCDTVPGLLLCRGSITEEGITQYFSTVGLDDDSADANKALAEHLAKVRDAVYADAKQNITALQGETEEYRDTFLRRADVDYISILTMYTGEGMFDTADDNRFSAHSYHTDDGSEIELSEVIADEDAFYDRLAGRLADQIRTRRYYGSLASMTDREKLKGLLKDYMDHGTAAWTIDAQGVTVFINSYSDISALPLCVSVRFSQDKKGEIFREAFAKAKSDEWIMQLVPGIFMFYDENDFGQERAVRAGVFQEPLEEAEEETYGIGGCIIDTGFDMSKWKVKETGATGYYDFFLIHTNHQNYLLAAHPEGKRAYFEEFKLLNDSTSKIDNFRGGLERTEISISDDKAEYAYYLPTDRTAIRVSCPADDAHDDTMEAWINAVVGIKPNGYFDEKPYEREDAEAPSVSLGSTEEEMQYCISHAGPAVELTPEMQYRYNLFLSNFAEQADFSYTDYSVADLCHFALEWKKINAPKDVKMTGDEYMITQSEVNTVLNGRINTNIEESDFADGVKNDRHRGIIADGYYREPLADGEMYKNNRFAVVTDMHECNTGTYSRRYLCNFKVYARDEELYDAEGIGKAQYSLSEAHAENDPELYCLGEGQALLWVYGLYGPDADVALAYYEMK